MPGPTERVNPVRHRVTSKGASSDDNGLCALAPITAPDHVQHRATFDCTGVRMCSTSSPSTTMLSRPSA
ncbi:hypothetical protein BDW22DRAFT_1363891 [Trametopsis cervina]|nr:hypothetical protein BDW22DRAFT_1363891 [Trametopsis cervina]